MATARKLPSGSWRCRIYVGNTPDGKKKVKSFTAGTKRQAEQMAAKYLEEHPVETGIADLTVEDAIERYISAKEAVLSPSTIRAYRSIQRNRYDGIGKKKVFDLLSEDMQLFISGMADEVSAKTVSNTYALLSSAVAMFRPDAVFRVTLPRRKKQRRTAPSDRDVMELFSAAGHELKLAIALAAFGSLRRGEICALKHKDVNGCTINVHADMVHTKDGVFVYKDFPKTSDSLRTVQVPQKALELIGDGVDEDYIFHMSPNALTDRFVRLRNKLGLSDIRFHDLRHYYASIGAVLGIPDTYLSQFGGWRPDSGIMKNVYQNSITDASGQYADAMTAHFTGLLEG